MKLPMSIVLLFITLSAEADGWTDKAPVVSARPVYTTSPACHPDAARRLGATGITDALREDLERARCEADSREISGWFVTYRYAGRDYARILPKHPGRFIEIEVEVRPDRG